MATAEDEAITIRPVGPARRVLHHSRVEDVSEIVRPYPAHRRRQRLRRYRHPIAIDQHHTPSDAGQRPDLASLGPFRWHPYAIDQTKDYSTETPTLVEFKLKATPDGGTHLIVTESGFDKIPAGRRPEALRMNDGGWTEQMKNIEAYVAQT